MENAIGTEKGRMVASLDLNEKRENKLLQMHNLL